MLSLLACTYLAADTLILERGARVQGSIMDRYWDVQEAQIDAEGAGLPIPTGFGLSGDARRSILLRFGSLDLAVGDEKQIADAVIRIKLSNAEFGAVSGVRMLKRPWLWPGIQPLSRRVKALPKDAPIPFAPGVTWSKAGGDVGNWQTPGALGNEDSEKLNAKIEVNGDTVTISGLGKTFQYLKTHEGDNFGLLLECSGKVEMWSSLAPADRPRLELTLAPGSTKVGNAWLTTNGDRVVLNSDQPMSGYRVFAGTQAASLTSANGAANQLELKLPSAPKSKDNRNSILRVVPVFEDASLAVKLILINPAATWLDVTPSRAREWNLNRVDASTYSFAPLGALSHVNPNGNKDTVGILSTLIPKDVEDENLTDVALLAGLVPPARPTNEPLFKQLARPETGPLTMFQVDRLMNPAPSYPGVLILRAVTPDGTPLVGTKLKFADQPELTTDKNGYAFPASPAKGFIGTISVAAESFGVRDSFSFSSAKLSNIFARGMTQAASIELPFNLPISEISRDTNLVLGKPVRDSSGSFPAQLLAVTDDKDLTVYPLQPKQWVEIDLGRDRFLGELELRGDVPSALLVSVYGTSEKIDESRAWIAEADMQTRRAFYPDAEAGVTVFRPRPMGGRYVRILNASDKVAELKGVRVFATKRGN
jgi:hypothetical protein